MSRTVVARGSSASTLLGVAFVILKLTGVIAWSWLWVLAPFWITYGLGLLVFAVVAAVLLIAEKSESPLQRSFRAYGRRR